MAEVAAADLLAAEVAALTSTSAIGAGAAVEAAFLAGAGGGFGGFLLKQLQSWTVSPLMGEARLR